MKVTIRAENSAGERFTAEVEMSSKEEVHELTSFRNAKLGGSRRDVEDTINNDELVANAKHREDRKEMRAKLNDISRQEVTLGDQLILVGRQILDSVFWIMKKCPNNDVGKIVQAVIFGVAGAVPVISFVIGSILKFLEPILERLTKAAGELTEYAQDLIQKEIDRFNPLRTNPA